ncbi:hypothetical protein D3C85_518460 [compost metagenome]
MLQYFAGPIFTDWYWIPVFYIMFTGLYAILFTLLALAVVATNNSLTSKKTKRLPNNAIKKTLIVCAGLWLLGLVAFSIVQLDHMR